MADFCYQAIKNLNEDSSMKYSAERQALVERIKRLIADGRYATQPGKCPRCNVIQADVHKLIEAVESAEAEPDD